MDLRGVTARKLLREAQRLLPGRTLRLRWYRVTTLVPGATCCPCNAFWMGSLVLTAWNSGDESITPIKVRGRSYGEVLVSLRKHLEAPR